MVWCHPKPCVFFTKWRTGETSCAAYPSGKDACESLHLSLKVHSLSVSAKCEQYFWDKLEGKIIFLLVLLIMQPSMDVFWCSLWFPPLWLSAFFLVPLPEWSPMVSRPFHPSPLPLEFKFLPCSPSPLWLSWRNPPPPPPCLVFRDILQKELDWQVNGIEKEKEKDKRNEKLTLPILGRRWEKLTEPLRTGVALILSQRRVLVDAVNLHASTGLAQYIPKE